MLRPVCVARDARNRVRLAVQERIAVIFDFDDTLAPDSTSSFVASLGVDVRRFWAEDVNPLLEDGWDPVPAYLFWLLKLSRGRPRPITREQLVACGGRVRFFKGVTKLFDRIRSHVASKDDAVSVEFYLVSSGLGEILRSTRIADQFSDIWACDFAYDEGGAIQFPKNVVSFTDKTRYLFQIAKGITGAGARGKPFEVNRKVPTQHLRVPFDQMIFVGDGYTDIPCFSMIRNLGGVAIGVYDPNNQERWGRAWGFIEDGRVSNLVPADYTKGSALSNSLLMAAESMTRKIGLRRSTYQG